MKPFKLISIMESSHHEVDFTALANDGSVWAGYNDEDEIRWVECPMRFEGREHVGS